MHSNKVLIGLSARTVSTLALVLLLGLAATPAASQTPNVLVLLVDDWGIEHISFYGIGSEFAPTPNLTALAGDALVFQQAWSNPNSSPTRVSIQTGRYGFRTGIGEPIPHSQQTTVGMALEEFTLAEMLQQNVGTPYATGAFGKWHMGADDSIGGLSAPNWAGYDHFDGMLVREQTVPMDYFNYTSTTNGTSQNATTYATTYTVDSAINWINNTSGPWLAHVGFWAFPAHWPPSNLHSQDTSQQSDLVQFRAMTEAVDTEIGRLLAAIDTTNTLIVVTTDNGSEPPTNLPPVLANRAKGTVFQGGIRVPLLIEGDMVTAGSVDAIVNLSDLYATIGEVAGATLPVGVDLDSVSLVPYFSNAAATPLREYVYSERFSPNGPGPYAVGQQTARNAEYKYLRTTSGAEGLIHIATDPWETNNLLFGEMSTEDEDAYDELLTFVQELLGICTLGQQGESCVSNDECCSGRCRGRRNRKTCRDLAF